MYCNIFIVMYLTTSFSNAILFKNPPFNEDMELTMASRNVLKNLYIENTMNNQVMKLTKFDSLLVFFRLVHNLDDREIITLFFDEVQNNKYKIMNLDQFLKQMKKVVQIIEDRLKTIYEKYLNKDKKMTTNELIKAIDETSFKITQDKATKLINNESIDKQDISFEKFREMYAKYYHEVLDDLKQIEDLKNLASRLAKLEVTIYWTKAQESICQQIINERLDSLI
ncbi:uncharacterized protein LOC126896166 isoform X4 [Daktulosphaira vitifoliae]|uniref:uncharacterized protein LOC126896166 isoform X4 n=1 Tax=Daktulosphaira vitifoliae TaxID=58002 RepID=UPI0021A98EFB|nr:uncharacterized protein LOC126896166 isoform X4 [Daktulosphaira vitifoliae]